MEGARSSTTTTTAAAVTTTSGHQESLTGTQQLAAASGDGLAAVVCRGVGAGRGVRILDLAKETNAKELPTKTHPAPAFPTTRDPSGKRALASDERRVQSSESSHTYLLSDENDRRGDSAHPSEERRE